MICKVASPNFCLVAIVTLSHVAYALRVLLLCDCVASIPFFTLIAGMGGRFMCLCYFCGIQVHPVAGL